MIVTDGNSPDNGPRDTFSMSGPGLAFDMPTRTSDDYAVEMRMALEDIRDRARDGIRQYEYANQNTAGPGGRGGAGSPVDTLRCILEQVALVEKRWWAGR